MEIADLVPLYLTIVMIVLIVIAVAGPGDKNATNDYKANEEDIDK
ncbi:MAG: hypothetical protein ACRDBM_17730 [Sporomusa sp.]